MTLTSNLQKTVALSLSEGFGIPLPAAYLENREHFVTDNGAHVGRELLWDLEDPEFALETVTRSKLWVKCGASEYEKLKLSAHDSTTSMVDLIHQWGNMFQVLYHGALDHVVPFTEITRRISELSNIPLESELLFQILTPRDGKSWHYHYRHPILLHLAYTFRRCPSGLQIGTYDSYHKNWLDLHFMARSLDGAVNPSVDPTRNGIAEIMNELHIPRVAYERNEIRPENEIYFNTIRNALRSLGEERITFAWRSETAQTEILGATPEPSRQRVSSLLSVISEAFQLNEEIHYQVYKGLNILRLAAQARGELRIPLSIAFSAS